MSRTALGLAAQGLALGNVAKERAVVTLVRMGQTGPVQVPSVPYVLNGRRGRPVRNFGLGGQTISQIADRIIADPIFGKECDMVLIGLENDSNSTAAAWMATITPHLDRIVAYRKAGSRTIITTPITSTAWSQPYRDAAFALIPLLQARYGSLVLDITTPFCNAANGNYPEDRHAEAIGSGGGVHPNDLGYSDIYTLINTAMTARSWATP